MKKIDKFDQALLKKDAELEICWKRMHRYKNALEQFAQCNLNDDNCASLSVANARIRHLATLALRPPSKERG